MIIKTTRCEAFSLLDTIFALSVSSMATVIVSILFTHVWSVLNLQSTTATLAYRLRDLQQLAQTQGQYTQARMSLYTPSYQTYQGTKMLSQHSFPPGVHYYDGYLQMTTGNFLYDILGNAQMAGTLRLVDGNNEQDISFYMGNGCAVMGRVRGESH